MSSASAAGIAAPSTPRGVTMMRLGGKIALVGGVPILIAAAIALAAWLLLAQEERARSGAVLAGRVYHDLTVARMVRDGYVAAQAPDRAAHAARFLGLTAEAGGGLEALEGYARTQAQAARVTSAQESLSRYVARMNDVTQVTRESDARIAQMVQHADTLIALADRTRQRQQTSNADLVRALGEKVDRLGRTRDLVAAINALRVAASGIVADTPPVEPTGLRAAARTLADSLRVDGRAREAGELDALAAADASASEEEGGLAGWVERLLTRAASEQRNLHDEVARLITYAIEANETEQATQNIAVTTLKLGQRTADAIDRRDPGMAGELLDDGRRLSEKAASLSIAPHIQGEMIEAIDGWRSRLATTIGGLKRQNEMIAEMDALASAMGDSARALNDAFIGDADRVGTSIRRLLLVGALGGLLFGSLVAVRVARSILIPLRDLQSDMIALAARPTDGTLRGTARRDELGDIARATNFFVSEIGRRERALRRAKDQADVALADLNQAQADLIRVEKLASLGQLVAGVAHEINTPLGIALTTGSLVRDETRAFQAFAASGQLSRSRLTHFVDRVGEGAHLICANLTRAADLVHGFKQVAVDRVSDERRSFDLASWLDELIASLQPLLRRGGHVIHHECPAGIAVDTNPGALAQVVTNLVNNAVVHGFKPGQPGEIALRIDKAAEGTIQLDVSDNGMGIAPENLGRIFDPFFTTARNRGSTGLGMHIVHNLVTVKLGGRIAIESEPGRGTTARIEFPTAPAALERAGSARDAADSSA